MQLTVKTLQGKNFPIDVDPSSTVGQTKQIIEQTNSEFPATQQKLIHSGKVLKDDAVLQDSGVKENEFLVVMLTKPKKSAAAATPAPTAAEPTPAPAAAAPSPAAASEPEAATSTSATPAAPTPAAPAAPAVSPEAIASLAEMGFPETESRAALEAAARVGGGQELALQFLMDGIPANFPPAGAVPSAAPSATTTPAGGTGPLEELRNHPQFNQLRQLVQSNPAALEPVLQQIGQQSPQLLDQIRSNQAAFLQMLNEPVEQTPAPSAQGGMPGGGGQAQQMMAIMQHIQQLPPEERERFAQQMGMPPQVMQQMTQMMQNMSPEQLQQMMGMVMGGGGPGGPGGAGGPGGPNVIHLTQEEAQAVERLQGLGFSQQEAIQAYLACDKNEDLAANFLFDGGMGGGDFGMPPLAATPEAAPTAAPATQNPPSTDAAPDPAPEGGDEDDDEMYN